MTVYTLRYIQFLEDKDHEAAGDPCRGSVDSSALWHESNLKMELTEEN